MIKQRRRTGKIKIPVSPAMKTRRSRSATVMRSIKGQMNRSTVVNSGSGSDLSFGLKMRKALVRLGKITGETLRS